MRPNKGALNNIAPHLRAARRGQWKQPPMLMQGDGMRHPLPGGGNGQIKRGVTRTEHIKLRHRVK